MLVGYARVSTAEQNLDLQLEALRGAGCERLFGDRIGGDHAERPGLAAGMAAAVRRSRRTSSPMPAASSRIPS